MPRPLRIEYPGAIYHAMSRGNGRQRIFKDRQDYQMFLATLAQACDKTGWQIHAWCLMSNHFHAVIETPQPNLVTGMKWLLGVYTKRFNIRHKTCGHLFAGRYKALPVDHSGTGYLRTVCDYVHLNPVRAKLIKPRAALESYPWSSYRQYLVRNRPPWLRVDRLMGETGIAKDSEVGRQEFARRMQVRQTEGTEDAYEEARRSWCVGSDAFRKELQAAAEGKLGPTHSGWERQEGGEQKAERIIREGLKELGWREKELDERRKGDKGKVRMARRLRQETTMTLAWIAKRLKMGSRTYVENLVYETKGKV